MYKSLACLHPWELAHFLGSSPENHIVYIVELENNRNRKYIVELERGCDSWKVCNGFLTWRATFYASVLQPEKRHLTSSVLEYSVGKAEFIMALPLCALFYIVP